MHKTLDPRIDETFDIIANICESNRIDPIIAVMAALKFAACSAAALETQGPGTSKIDLVTIITGFKVLADRAAKSAAN